MSVTIAERTEDVVRCLVVGPDGTGSLEYVAPKLPDLKALIGDGWLEGISGGTWHAYCDGDGKLKDLPANIAATRLVAQLLPYPFGDVVCGIVAFFGTSPDGEEADVPARVVAHARRLGILSGQ